jgi:nucleoid-associated protein YgaU
MKRAIVAALLACLVPGVAAAQEEPESAGPEVTEPQTGVLDQAKPDEASSDASGSEAPVETYTVVPGDTLWDLSQRFLGNPWYWPKVWSYNPQVQNPHWIYPGNELRFYPDAEGLPVQVEAGSEPEIVSSPPNEIGDVSSGSLSAAEQFGQDDDVVTVTQGTKISYTPPRKSFMRQDGLITRSELEESGVIAKAWAEKEMLATLDKVYLRFKNKSAVKPGERYTIFRAGSEVFHPVTGKPYGYLTHVIGALRVVAIDQHLVSAVIERAFEDIHRGDLVAPLGNFDRAIASKRSTREIQGVILASLISTMAFMGEQHVVFIDKGARDGVEEGNTFAVVRRGDPLHADSARSTTYPAEDVATLLVVDVKENASAALVMRSIRELVLGDRVVTEASAAPATAAP